MSSRGGMDLLYFLFTVGLVLFLYGLRKSRLEKKTFSVLYDEASEKEDIKLVNHSINEETLKKDIDHLYREIEKIKEDIAKAKIIPEEDNDAAEHDGNEQIIISYKELSERLKNADDLSLEKLSREMNIGKGELLLLKNLSKR